MPHDPPTGDREPAKTVCKRLEIVAPDKSHLSADEYYVIGFNENINRLKVLTTGTLDQCLEFVRENMA